MLTLLHIENIAVIEKAEIEFDSGLNVLTGETGAGKSIVIDSLEAALGWRTSKDLVRSGANTATVSAVFTPDGAEEWCAENDIELEDELILTRKLTSDGKSSCRINGSPVSAAQMRELGLLLIDIHGQGDGQRLVSEQFHREYLDSYAGISAQLAEYRTAYSEYEAVRREIDELTMDEGEKARRVDMLDYQIGELERANLVPGEYEEKSKRREFLKSAGKLSEVVSEAFFAIYGGERTDGAVSMLGAASGAISYGVRYSQELSALAEKLENLKLSAEDAAEELRDMRERLEFSPEELDELDSRLDKLRRIFKKYNCTDEEQALEILEKCRQERDTIEYSDEKLKKLEGKLEKYKAEAEKLAGVLTEKRLKAGTELSSAIETELNELSMAGARFCVDVSRTELCESGRDNVSFRMAANAGEAMGRICKVASGGELSRIMLAMKKVLAATDSVNAMVFDEIDTGVSGIAAQRVAEKLSGISGRRQVICVTHLPQIAAMADCQFSIEKRTENGRTRTDVKRLDMEGRTKEIAKLTGGENITETTLAAAVEQLQTAEKYKTALFGK